MIRDDGIGYSSEKRQSDPPGPWHHDRTRRSHPGGVIHGKPARLWNSNQFNMARYEAGGKKMTESNCIRVLIVDDHPMVRNGLSNFILAYDWMETVGEARDGAEAVGFCATHEVDVVLMDMVMPVMDGSEATRRIMELGKPPKVIVLTSFHEKDLVQQAMKAGATSYLLKNVSAEGLAEAIRAAHQGFCNTGA